MALQQMCEKKNTFFFYLSESVQFFNPRQILFAVPLKIVPSRTKFVKSRQTIRICYYTAYS